MTFYQGAQRRLTLNFRKAAPNLAPRSHLATAIDPRRFGRFHDFRAQLLKLVSCIKSIPRNHADQLSTTN